MLLANFNRKEHLRHRAVSLRQHGFLVIIDWISITHFYTRVAADLVGPGLQVVDGR